MSAHACQNPCAGGHAGGACCEACASGEDALAPPANRGGRRCLDARVGDYAGFFSQAIAGLSGQKRQALSTLGTREPDDATIALIDAWAIAADVLTFYRERYTQEGYLRTAREERSLRELAAQVGYRPRPGVAATVPLAYMLENNAAPLTIPAGARCQSVPRPGEQMQTFETDEALEARAEWSLLEPLRRRVPGITREDALLRPSATLQGTSLAIRPGERLLFVFSERTGMQVARTVTGSAVDIERGVTEVRLAPRKGLNVKSAPELIGLLEQSFEQQEQQGTARILASYLLGSSISDCVAQLELLGDEIEAMKAREQLESMAGSRSDDAPTTQPVPLDGVLSALAVGRNRQLSSARDLAGDVLSNGSAESAQRGDLLRARSPALASHLYRAWRKLPGTARDPGADAPSLYLLRATHGAYAAASPMGVGPHNEPVFWSVAPQDENPRYAYLDAVNENVLPDSYMLFDVPITLQDTDHGRMTFLAKVDSVAVVARSSYGPAVKVSRLELAPRTEGDAQADGLRRGVLNMDSLAGRIYTVQSEPVSLAAEPIAGDIGGSELMLDRLYEDLRPGRWIIVSGERTDVVPAPPEDEKNKKKGDSDPMPVEGLQDAELALIAAVEQRPDTLSPGSGRLTVLQLQTKLSYRYRRATARIHGNVAMASHGETVNEVLGSGDSRVANPAFALKRPPLTFVPAVSTSGIAGTQVVRINQLRWRQVDSLLDAEPDARVYQLDAGADGATVLTFGDGVRGARPPTGADNVRATYRTGLGKAGNVRAEQISLLATRPLGVQGVLNPLPATGGADPDGAEHIRDGIPMAVRALSPRSRLVSVEDYAVFARRFAAIGHARAEYLPEGGRRCVHVTVTGVDDLPLEADSGVMAALMRAFHTYGDPAVPVRLDIRERLMLLLQARVAIDPDADWDVVEPRVRARLLDAFSAARRGLARAAYASEAIAAMQAVAGVAWVDLDLFGALSEQALSDAAAWSAAYEALRTQGAQPRVACLPARPSGVGADARLLPAQMACLAPEVPSTLVLNLVKETQP